MKKILMMGLTPPLEGGSERHIYEISSRLKESRVFTQKGSLCKNALKASTIGTGGFITNISFFFSSLFYSIYLLFGKRKFDLIHIHENLLYLLVPFLKIRYKVIVTVHGITGFRFYENKILWVLFRLGLKFSDKIISVSLADKELLEKEFEKVVYMPNGVDIELYEKIKAKNKENKIVFVGRIHEQKGIETLLKSFLLLKKKYENYKIEIIGKKEGELYEKLSEKYKDENIIWKGFILDRKVLFSEISSAKILVFPSIWEALPWPALLEGLGSGNPVVASDLLGMRYVFNDGNEILLAKPKNPEDLAEKISKLIDNPELAKKIGKEGKKKARKFSWQNIAKEIQRVYNNL